MEQSQGDSPLDPERKGKPFGVGDPEFKLKAPLTGESSRKASKYSVGPTVQGDVPRLPSPLPRAARPGPAPAPVKIFSGEGGEGGAACRTGGSLAAESCNLARKRQHRALPERGQQDTA